MSMRFMTQDIKTASYARQRPPNTGCSRPPPLSFNYPVMLAVASVIQACLASGGGWGRLNLAVMRPSAELFDVKTGESRVIAIA